MICTVQVFIIQSVPLVFQVVVQRVHIDGLGRTKEDLLTYEISGVFRAKNLIDVGARKYSSANRHLFSLCL